MVLNSMIAAGRDLSRAATLKLVWEAPFDFHASCFENSDYKLEYVRTLTDRHTHTTTHLS